MSAVQSCQYSPDGNFLALGESDDFVSIYSTQNHTYQTKQTIDLIGCISGISFCPSSNSLFIGIDGLLLGGIIQYEKINLREIVYENLL